MGGLLLLTAAASVGGMEIAVGREVRERLEEDLAGTALAMTAALRAARDRLEAEARVVSEEPRLKAVLHADVGRATVDDVAGELRKSVRWDLLVLVDARGRLRSLSGASEIGADFTPPTAAGLW